MEQILKASYGDRKQREANKQAKEVDALRAAQIKAEWRRKRPGRPAADLPGPPPAPKGFHPPHWDSKLYGEAYGDGNLRPHAKQDAKPKPPATVEVQPGVMAAVEPVPPARKAVKNKPYQQTSSDKAKELASLEEQMRQLLRQKADVHAVERMVLLHEVGDLLGKHEVAIGVHDRLSVEQFCTVWKRLGLPMSESQAAALFNKYGQDRKGRLPALVLADSLLVGAPRLLMAGCEGIQRGAYRRDKPGLHMGKIRYPQCRKGVFPPSDWDPALAQRSSQIPEVRLRLEWVHGYDGLFNTAPNLFYAQHGLVVYYTAAVGVVYDPVSHQQRFFLGHDDDILCMSIAPDRSLVATGQCGLDPCVIVWDIGTQKPLQRLFHGRGFRGVQAVAWSGDGRRLATICTDNSHSMSIWDWKRGELLLQRKTQPGAPPAVYGAVWSSYDPTRIVTFGQNHIKFWELREGEASDGGMAVQMDAGKYGKGNTHTVLCACFLPSGLLLTGNPDGQICSWKGPKCCATQQAHGLGPKVARPDGTQSHSGVRVLRLRSDSKVLLSGGADGMIRHWDVSKGSLGAQLRKTPIILRSQESKEVPGPLIRALDCRPGSDVFIVGTHSCDIWEVDADPEMLLFGHQADLYGLAANPAFPHIYATFCESSKVAVWNALDRKVLRVLEMGVKARSGAWSPDGNHLAVGMKSGGLKVLEFYPHCQQLAWVKTFNSAVSVLSYSPDGKYLAAGSHDQLIDIFSVRNQYRRVARCAGHSSTVCQMDWSADSSVIQSTCQAYEILYFDPHSGKQIKENQRDTQWASWTSVLGFGVMGIWPEGSDGTDVNSVHRSPSGRFLLAADDFGKVRLFNFPCVVEHAPCHIYHGHSSHVMNVRWSADESYAVSVGGKDRAVFQWSVVPSEQKPEAHAPPAPWAPRDAACTVWGPAH